METTNYIAQCRIDDCATVRVLSIRPNTEIICDRECSSLKESKDGSIQCYIGWIKKMVNFKASALLIDYEVFLDRKTKWDWSVHAADFPIIDENGDIYEGEFLCDSIVSPEQLKNSPRTLFPGTRGRYRVYYESFPKDGIVSSIIALADNGSQGRMDLLNPDPEQGVTIDQSQPMAIAPQQKDVQQQHVIVPEKEHNVPEPKATPKPKKKEIGCFTFATIIISCFLVSGPLAYFLIEDFFENGNEYGLYVGIFFIVISIGLCILFIRGGKKRLRHSF